MFFGYNVNMNSGIYELGVIIVIAAVFGIIARRLRQPVILAYILTGALIASLGFFNLGDKEIFNTFSELGVMFLLFLIGLEIDYASLRSVGKTSIIIGFGQIIFTVLIGFVISLLLGWDQITSAYVALALTFSSTIIIIKMLTEKKDLNSLYGKICIGILLVQDFVAVIALLLLTGIGSAGAGFSFIVIGETILKGILFFGLMLWLGRKIIPHLFDKFAKSKELIFLTSMAWCFLVAILTVKAGFSVQIGGLLAGLSLANSSNHFQIGSNMRYLRVFFSLIFFVLLGSSLVLSNFTGLLIPIILYSLFVIIGNPLIVMIIMGTLGYTKRTSFLCGISIAQISEFSLILVALGFKLGHLSNQIVPLVTAVSIITIIVSTNMMVYSEQLFRFFSPYLFIFERAKTKETEIAGKDSWPIIIVGYNRTGQSLVKHIKKEDVLVVDFDPDTIKILKENGYHYILGDISDEEIFDLVDLNNTRVIISTSSDFEDNMTILERINKFKRTGFSIKTVFIVENEKDLKFLYEKGADYVLLPHSSIGDFLGKVLETDPELKNISKLILS